MLTSCAPVVLVPRYVVAKVSMRVRQLNVMCETKTLDNVFVSVRGLRPLALGFAGVVVFFPRVFC